MTEQEAIEYFKAKIETAEAGEPFEELADDAVTVTLSLEDARLILACAQRGLLKRHGRGGVTLSIGGEVERAFIDDWAKTRKAELKEQGHSVADAEKQAAEEACEIARRRFGIKRSAKNIARVHGWKSVS